MGRKGMTLIEIMIVVALIAIMAAVAAAIYRPYIRKARRSDAFTVLKACYTAQQMYRAEHGEYCNMTESGDGFVCSDNITLSGCERRVPEDSPYYLVDGRRYDNGTFSIWANPTGSQEDDEWSFCINQDGDEYVAKDPNASGPCPGGNWELKGWEKI